MTSFVYDDRRRWPHRCVRLSRIASFPLAMGWCSIALGATIAPPMLDITRQCDAVSRHNATAMSECVVAESEARSELLQKWDRLSDESVQKCIKIGRKARKLPYTAIVKCLSVEQVDLRPPETAAASAPAKPADGSQIPPVDPGKEPKHDGFLPSWLSYPLKH